MRNLTFGSLFSGIGGLDLGMERAGMKCLWQSEIDPYASRVLAKHWPTTPNLGDIRGIDWQTVPTVDVVAGGYPCQPFSTAGKRNGEHDPRHLWPMFAECLSVVRPRYALMENVSGHLSLGFGHVLGDLVTLGYDAQWDCIPAAAVGAPHLRDRVFIIATRRHGMDTDSDRQSNGTVHAWPKPRVETYVADTNGKRLGVDRSSTDVGQNGGNGNNHTRRETPHGAGSWWQIEPGMGRVADGVPHRVDRLRGLGNAVVPQVAEHVANIILRMEEHPND